MISIPIKQLSRNDVHAVALLHQEGITTGFLSGLGPRFLSALYCAIANSRWSRVFVALPEGADQPVGFVAASIDTGRMYKDVLLRRGLRFVWHLAPQVFRPVMVKNMVETVLYPVFHAEEARAEALSQAPSNAAVRASRAELLAIAVDKDWQGRGVGRLLVNEMEQYFKESNVEQYKVVTSRSDGTANAFYQALGFSLKKTFLHHRREMCRYIKRV